MSRILKSVYAGNTLVCPGELAPGDQIEGGLAPAIYTLTDAATITINLNTGCNFALLIGGNRAMANPTALTPGQSGSIVITQDGTGSRTLSWSSYWKFAGGVAPTLSTAANAVDRLDYYVVSATQIHAVMTKAYA
jgi:hypothetical protein